MADDEKGGKKEQKVEAIGEEDNGAPRDEEENRKPAPTVPLIFRPSALSSSGLQPERISLFDQSGGDFGKIHAFLEQERQRVLPTSASEAKKKDISSPLPSSPIAATPSGSSLLSTASSSAAAQLKPPLPKHPPAPTGKSSSSSSSRSLPSSPSFMVSTASVAVAPEIAKLNTALKSIESIVRGVILLNTEIRTELMAIQLAEIGTIVRAATKDYIEKRRQDAPNEYVGGKKPEDDGEFKAWLEKCSTQQMTLMRHIEELRKQSKVIEERALTKTKSFVNNGALPSSRSWRPPWQKSPPTDNKEKGRVGGSPASDASPPGSPPADPRAK